MREKILIGLTGKSGSGKSTAADYLWSTAGFLEMAFADRLKEATSVLFGWDRLALDDQEYKAEVCPVWGITRREGLQKLGTEAVRGVFGDDFWIKAWRQVYDQVQGIDNVVVSDVRFFNEADTIRAMGGVIVHIVRPGVETVGVPDHVSESGVEVMPDDYVIMNDGSVEQLYEQLDGLLEYLGELE